jgi:tRNA A-37 threonylcarbamoyl transferase component Bud32
MGQRGRLAGAKFAPGLMALHGRYTVVRKLANGGMAEIFLASQTGHEGFQKPVVLKRILSTIYADPQFRNMLIDEAHISMSLTHSNIVQVLDLGLADGGYFLVLELVDGWDLGLILQRGINAGWPLPLELGLFVVTEVCRALAYAHGKHGADGKPLGIVHRDISPNNVLISEHGEVKLADFGIAKAMNKREQTGTGVVKGKVSFMSPEQALGRAIDARSDVFSLGTLLYLVMIGDRPFDGSTDLETLLRVQRGDYKLPSRARPDLLPEISRIIEHAMRFLPDERYATADDMLLDLERVLRTSFGGVGQTELKQYLAELGRRDGVPPIGRANPIVDDRESSGGAALVEGNAVVLGDAKDDMSAERTDLAELMSVEGDTRFGRRTVDLARGSGVPSTTGRHETLSGRGGHRVDMFGREPTPPRASRRVVEELSIPEGAVTEEAPERFRRRKSRAVPIFMMLLVLCGGGLAAAKYLGLLDTGAGASGGGAAAVAPPAGAPAPVPAVPAPAEAPAPKAPTAVAPAAPATAPAGAAPSPAPAAEAADSPPAALPQIPPPPEKQGAPPRAGAPAQKSAEKPAARRGPKVPHERNVFKESAKRVRSLSQGLDQFPPGTIQLAPPTSDTPQ